MRVLLVSYYFPPAAGGGVQRVLKWTKYLPQSGIEVHVLAPDDPKWIDSDGGLRITPGTHVHRSRNLSPRSLRPAAELARARGPLRRLLRRLALQPRRLLVPDIHRPWAWTAVRAGVDAVREHGIDIIVATTPPKTDLLIAQRIARRCGIPWVADYRDSWLDLPHLRLERRSVRWKHARMVRMANRIMRTASAAITVSEPLAADLRRRHPQLRVEVIENGVDLADLEGIDEPAANDRFTLTYTGNFFGRQSPSSLLEALRILAQRRPRLASELRVQIVGGMQPAAMSTIDGDDVLCALVERVGFMDYEDVLVEQRAADMLYLYVAPGAGSDGIYTGKVFEYVASRRPILAAVPAHNVSARLVTAAGSGIVVDPDAPAAIADAIEHELTIWHADGRRQVDVPADVIASISRQAQARRLAGLLRELAGVSAHGR